MANSQQQRARNRKFWRSMAVQSYTDSLQSGSHSIATDYKRQAFRCYEEYKKSGGRLPYSKVVRGL